MTEQVNFLAFQWWFRMENWSIIKETLVIFVNFGQSWYH